MNGLILSHIPVHETQLRRFGTNIHGHLHSGRIMKTVRNPKFTGAWMDSAPDTIEVIDPRYHCVCVEQTDFKPISFDDVQKRIEAEGGTLGFNNGNR
jgi:calcineurin-like phosphoesterase family protein